MSESTKRSLLSYFKVEPKRLKTTGDEDDPQEIPENPQLQCNSKNNISTSSSNLVSINDTSLNEVRIECTNELSTEQIVCSYDISLYVGPKARKIDSKTRFELLNKEDWNPNFSYRFPTSGKRNLRFQFNWLNRWKWLVYSKIEDGVYCKICVLFGYTEGGRGHQQLGKLVLVKFNNWKNSFEKFNSHEHSEYHKTALMCANNLIAVFTNKKPAVDVMIDNNLKTTIQNNRNKIRPIIETIILCGRQGIAIRGHRDSGTIDLTVEPTQNEGNFRALLRYRALGGDTKLAEHLNDCAKNATYLSGKMQNEIIQICGQIIQSKIVDKVNKCQSFSVLADETTDVAGIEQLSLSVRYFDKEKKQIVEEFLTFTPVHDVTGKGLANKILQTLESLSLNLSYLKGQGYDGAASMSGKFNGVQAHIFKKFPLAPYIHCSSHSLNLAISFACNVKAIRNTMGTIQEVCTFFRTPKRQHTLTESIKLKLPEVKATRLKILCTTRWVEWHDSVILLIELFSAVIAALEKISVWLDIEASSKANRLFDAITKSEFIISIHIIGKIFAISLPLSRQLQTENIDLVQALQFASCVESTINSYRDNVIEEFSKEFLKVNNWCKELNLNISFDLTRTQIQSNKQMGLNEKSIEEFYRLTVFIPFLDSFLTQLHDRFLQHKNLLKNFSCLLPAKLSSSILNDGEDEIINLIRAYMVDIETTELGAIGELKLWRKYCTNLKSENAIDTYLQCDENVFPTVHKLLKYLITLPVTTASGERSFSTLKRLKTYLRNTTSENRLNGLALLNIHQEIKVTPENILNLLSANARKLNFRLD